MPSPLSDEELLKIIAEVTNSISVCGIKDMGKVMKEVITKVGGRGDTKRISELVREKLLSK
ncbi:MAG: GatB/YqeY domain-containing protein [Candidatus Omnitrophica bacterium]|nr:GatB/YqeY domain-containing protein [Candidatus Omnitrophota bacterium]